MHDLIDTKSRVILQRQISEADSAAERKVALEMLKTAQAKREDLGIPKAIQIVTADAGYGTGAFAAAVLEIGIEPHMPLQAGPEFEPVPQYQRRTFDLVKQRKRTEKLRHARARNRVRELQRTRGYQVSRKLRIRSEHVFAEAKVEHGLDRVQVRGRKRVQVKATLTGVIQNLKRLITARPRTRQAQAQAQRLCRSTAARRSDHRHTQHSSLQRAFRRCGSGRIRQTP